jgi:hypothetical protein
LGIPDALPWHNTEDGNLVIEVPAAINKKIPCEHAYSFKIEKA